MSGTASSLAERLQTALAEPRLAKVLAHFESLDLLAASTVTPWEVYTAGGSDSSSEARFALEHLKWLGLVTEVTVQRSQGAYSAYRLDDAVSAGFYEAEADVEFSSGPRERLSALAERTEQH